ncbi:MAG: hypothetical protein Lokiarch_04930 [Candidatus Lokiarchaeum sp. GC14_75]|nr:MAG: hypothetical protein Lokiarch_04930 [Candidatus Lokiarchaeum sp. GC14_75]
MEDKFGFQQRTNFGLGGMKIDDYRKYYISSELK